jgi:hypothetical protein
MFLIATKTMCSPVPALLLESADLSSFVLECRASRERRASPQATIARKPEQQSASAWRMRGLARSAARPRCKLTRRQASGPTTISIVAIHSVNQPSGIQGPDDLGRVRGSPDKANSRASPTNPLQPTPPLLLSSARHGRQGNPFPTHEVATGPSGTTLEACML